MIDSQLQLVYELAKATSTLTLAIDKMKYGAQSNQFLEHQLLSVAHHIRELNIALAWLEQEQRKYFGNNPAYEVHDGH